MQLALTVREDPPAAAQLTLPVNRRWKWRRTVSIASLAARRPYGIDVDAQGDEAAPLLPDPCRCDRPAVQVDEEGDRRCVRCGRRAQS